MRIVRQRRVGKLRRPPGGGAPGAPVVSGQEHTVSFPNCSFHPTLLFTAQPSHPVWVRDQQWIMATDSRTPHAEGAAKRDRRDDPSIPSPVSDTSSTAIRSSSPVCEQVACKAAAFELNGLTQLEAEKPSPKIKLTRKCGTPGCNLAGQLLSTFWRLRCPRQPSAHLLLLCCVP